MIQVLLLLNIAICKLCGFRFNRTTEGRSITAHALLSLREHLKCRGIDISVNLKVQAEEFLSHTVIVCEVCYDLAVAEHHLIEVERELALALNIPIKPNESFVTNKAGFKNNTNSSIFMWRIMFYFDYINCEGDFSI